MRVIDLFSGAGGFSSGLLKSGFKVVIANEIDPQIAETYRKNHNNTLMINDDIKNFVEKFDEKIPKKLLEKKIDMIVGGPPCQGFSMAGARNRNGFIEDKRNFLFREYFKIIQKIEPDFFIMENVSGLKSMEKGKILEEILKIFSSENNFKNGAYHLIVREIKAEKFGVPQRRRRLIIIGSKYRKLDFEKLFNEVKEEMIKIDITRFNKIDLKNAIGDLNYLESGENSTEYKIKVRSRYQLERRKNSKKLNNHNATSHTEKSLERIKKIPPLGNRFNLNEKINSVHSGSYGRMGWEELAMTITTRFDTPSGGKFIHPERDRTITPREAARIQSFDDDFIFYGNKSSISIQIGNAVPPLVAEVLGNIIKKEIEKIKNQRG